MATDLRTPDSPYRLWLIGGTAESRWLVDKIKMVVDSPLLTVTVTTEAACSLYPNLSRNHLWIGQLTPDEADHFIEMNTVGAILDLSHPFATQISQLAIALAQRYQLPYLRYERANISVLPEQEWQDSQGRPGNICLSHISDLLTEEYLEGERTLLTLGYRMLANFQPWQARGILFARILPSQPALEASLKAGFTPSRLIALRPPISPSLEKSLWRQWKITQVVTKASGQPGGEMEKQAIAAELGVRLIRLVRPQLAYPNQTDSLDTSLTFALHYCKSRCEEL